MRKFCVVGALAAVLIVPAGLGAQQAGQLPELKQEAAAEVDKLQTFTQQMVDEIFSFSELGFQEYETSRYVTGILEKNAFRVEHGIAGVPTAWPLMGTANRSSRSLPTLIASRALRRSREWRITTPSSKARQGTERVITRGWPSTLPRPWS
jgi:hypothetical protein